MSFFVVRAMENGEHEEIDLEKGIVQVGWQVPYDLANVQDKVKMKNIVEESYYGKNSISSWKPDKGQISYVASQLYALVNKINIGDFAVLPLKKVRNIAIGRVTGPYEFRTDIQAYYQEWEYTLFHTRPVNWFNYQLKRDDMPEEICPKRPPGGVDGLQTVYKVNPECEIALLDQLRKRGMLSLMYGTI